MEKSETMKRYEAETGKQSTRFVTDGIHSAGIEVWHYEYIAWLEKIAKSTELKECPNCGAEVIPNPYVHDLEQRIELLEMQLEEAQSKAAAYDRLMSGGKKTPKEAANFLDLPIAQDKEGFWYAFGSSPVIDELRGTWGSLLGYEKEIPSCNIRYSGDWKNSLTLPDGWEEEICKSK